MVAKIMTIEYRICRQIKYIPYNTIIKHIVAVVVFVGFMLTESSNVGEVDTQGSIDFNLF